MRIGQLRRRALVGATTLALAASSVAGASGGWRVIASGSSAGGPGVGTAFAIVYTVRDPHALALRVVGSGQRVRGDWHVFCSQRGGPTRKLSGEFSGSTPLFRLMRLPRNHARCGADAMASIAGYPSGDIWIKILKR